MIRELGTVTAPALLMIGCGLLALVGSLWTERVAATSQPAPRHRSSIPIEPPRRLVGDIE